MTPAAITTLAQALIDSEPALQLAEPGEVTYRSGVSCTERGRNLLRTLQALGDINYQVGTLDAEWAGRVAAALHGLATHIESTRG